MRASVQPRRLMLVVPSARREGGGDIWLDQLLRHLANSAPTLTVVFETYGEMATRAASYGCITKILGGRNGTVRDDVSALVDPLAGVLAESRPDVTVFWSPRAQLYGSPAHAHAGRPGRTGWVQHVMPSTFWLHRDASALPSELVICVSSAVERRQRELYPGHATRVLHPGLDTSQAPLSQTAARARLGCAIRAPMIGVVGRVEPWKGQDVAARTVATLVERGVDAHLVLLGRRRSPTWPQFGRDVDRLIRELDLAERVTFAGHRCDVAYILPALDVVVCTSREEGFGLAIVEAMAAGVPVVATRCGGTEDILDHESTGLLVPVDDPLALAEAVESVLRQPLLAARLAARARRVWRDRFTAACSANAFRTLVSDLVAGRFSVDVDRTVAEDRRGNPG